MDDKSGLAYRFALHCAAQLAGSGVRTVVASPGFRNSPLLVAFHKTPGLDVVTAVDERGAAFLALGIARSQRAPVALLCTSGTAVGNYLPAIMEASHGKVPLLVLTGDRPQELVDTGANQCTDQTKIFGSHVRFFADTAPPSGADHEANHAGYIVGKATSRCLQPVPGPVHLNLRFREPFLPSAEECARIEAEERPRPWSFFGSGSGPTEEQALAVGSMVRAAKRPLLLLGPGCYGQRFLGRLCELSARTNIPVIAEAASGIAFCENQSKPRLIHRAENALEAMLDGALLAPDLFIRIGAPLTGRAYGRLLATSALPQLIFEEWGDAREPGFHPSVVVEGNLEAWLDTASAWSDTTAENAWVETLLAFDAKQEARIDTHLARNSAFTEWHFHRFFERQLGRGVNLFLGNSMPIRDFNSAFPRTAKRMRLFSNRGLSGIDGLIATATGVAYGSSRETHAVIGDLSALHDLPSLSLLSSLRGKINFTLWVMNNGGGEIFRMVKTAEAGPPEWFTTPQEFDLSAIAKSFRISFSRVHDLASLESIVPETFANSGVRLIEVLAGGEPNVKIRKSFRDAN
ncbi:MAG TPA: 2-succinyl-5-enolpyruvyl-6-hydroxy-3-cyclohexene-1-carboxylic-acid synthase [Bdellovibrionota bacterium]|jgi:2-succinyl-5-enolpyruvyl-6-hydroxy-3-cyclohexene-1-carboxylate synthase